MTHDEILAQLQREYDAKRQQNIRLLENRKAEVCVKCPEIASLLESRNTMLMQGIKKMLANMQQASQNGIDIRPQMDSVSEQIRAKLAENGFSADYLQPLYQCKTCKDYGYLFTPSKIMCDCMKKEVIKRELARFGMDENGPSFDKFSLALYADNGTEVSPRRLAEVALLVCKNFAEDYPNPPVKNMLITGTSGLGKTYLMQCMARRFMERLIPVEIVSAYRLIDAARNIGFENDDLSMDGYMEAPLLMIDDLGTEPLFNNITVTRLFSLINDRMETGKSTIISTNLRMSELQERYTERIASRLQDPRSWKYLHLEGEDIRKIRK